MKMTKKGSLDVNKYVTVIVSMIVLFVVVAALLPTLKASGQDLNTSIGGTIGGIFGTAGVLWTLLAVGILVVVIYAILPKKR
jgi:uncharacterized membrane protein